MALVNYTTEVDANKTVAEIELFLLNFGISKITKEYDDAQRPVSLNFAAFLLGQPQWFSLKVSTDAVLSALKNPKHKVPPRYQTRDHAFRVGWRIMKDLVRCQLSAVEVKQMEISEAFFSFIVDGDGITTYSHFLEARQKQLGTGETSD